MRKEVKLGMALGGGLVALLVAYLIVAPPSDHKHGAQLATGGDGQQSIIDPSSQSGGDSAQTTVVSDDKPAPTVTTPSDPAGLDKPQHQQLPAEQPKTADAKSTGGAGHDAWQKALDKGLTDAKDSKGGKGVTPVIPVSTTPTPEKSKDVAKAPAAEKHTTPKAERNEIKLASTPITTEADRGVKMYFTNPNAAWGDGLSTRSATEAVDAAPRGPSKPAKSLPSVAAAEESAGTLGSTSAVPTAGSTHIVRSGETFSSIAQAVYGSAAYYPHLIRANPQANPNNLKLGTAIVIPKLEDVKATAAPGEHKTAAAMTLADDVKIDPAKQYRVAAGDSLYKISIKRYGTPSYVEAIYEKNKQLIGPNATKLKLGMILDLPEKAAAAGAQTTSALGDGTSGAVAEQH
jgi:LysM repeat protein